MDAYSSANLLACGNSAPSFSGKTKYRLPRKLKVVPAIAAIAFASPANVTPNILMFKVSTPKCTAVATNPSVTKRRSRELKAGLAATRTLGGRYFEDKIPIGPLGERSAANHPGK